MEFSWGRIRYVTMDTSIASAAPRILSVGTANPEHRYSQREIYELSVRHFPQYGDRRIEHIFMTSDIDHRYFSFDAETMDPHESADELHARFAENALPMAMEAATVALNNAGCRASEIDAVVTVSCTGYLCPGISASLVKAMGFRPDVRRADLVGMGCSGAMPGLQYVVNCVRSHPEWKCLLVTVEICSACYYIDDSLETVVGNAICGDGAAAVVVAAEGNATYPRVLDFESLTDPSYIDSVGFQFRNGKLRIVLSKDLRSIAGGMAAKVIASLLCRHGHSFDAVRHWVIHSGGRKVIDGIRSALSLTEEQVGSSRRVLREFGNMSSPTVLFVLRDRVSDAGPQRGDLGVMLAMGPGLSVEGALVQW